MSIQHEAVDTFSLTATSGVMAAGLGAAAPIFSIRWATLNSLMIHRSFRLSAGGIGAFTAGAATFDLIRANGFTAADTDGNAVAWTAPTSNKHRLTMANSGFVTAGGMRIASTATLTAGTRVLDTNPFSQLVCGVPATAGLWTLPTSELLPPTLQLPIYPLILSAATAPTVEGLILRATVPAGGTWAFTVSLTWQEYLTY